MHQSLNLLLVILLGLNLISCDEPETSKRTNDKAAASEVKAGSSNAIKSKISASLHMEAVSSEYYESINYGLISLQSKSSACASEPKYFNLYNTNNSFGEMLKQDCSYQLTVDVGYQDLNSSTGKFTAYYHSQTQSISTEQIAAAQSDQPITLDIKQFILTDAGRTKNLPEFNKILESMQEAEDPEDTSNAGGQTPTTGSGGSSNTGTNPQPSNVFSGFAKISLKDPSGKTVTMDKVVKGKYAFIDLSADYCPYCNQLAKDINGANAFQTAVGTSGACSAVVIVDTTEISSWLKRYNGTFVSNYSYGGVSQFSQITKEFGRTFPGYIPYVMVVEVATGKVVSASSSLANFADKYCK